MVFHWRLSDSTSPQVTRTFLSILAFFDYIVVWMVSTRLPTSKSSSPFSNPLVTHELLFSNPLVTHQSQLVLLSHACSIVFFNFRARSRYLSFFSQSFSFILYSSGKAKSRILLVLLFLLIVIRYGLLAEMR